MDLMKIFKTRSESIQSEASVISAAAATVANATDANPPFNLDSLNLVEGEGPSLSLEYQSEQIDLMTFLSKWKDHYSLDEEPLESVVGKISELKEHIWNMPMYDESSKDKSYNRKWYKLWDVSPVKDIMISEIYWCTDIVLFRYLRSYKYDVKTSFNMLKKTLAWRRFRNIDGISPDVVGPCNVAGMLYRKGYDNSGRPVVYFRPHNEVNVDRETQVLLLYFTLERATQTVLLEHGNDKVMVILDLKNWSLSKLPSMETVIDTVRALSEHFTDVLHDVVLVDPPMLIDPLLQMIKAVLDSSTSKKIVIKRRGNLLENFLKNRIDAMYVEESMGGENTTQYDHSVYWEKETAESRRYQKRMRKWIEAHEEEWKGRHACEDEASSGRSATSLSGRE
ncbi:cral-trio lipid binding domain containing protein [Babesia gibsoni]|uniref:Cral-trio lipid binding domain containing protein n=1 Tax=Babesia gibsoni TaxID=33632 RepID=A0AAD8LL67_BABGI|nr:cral-trio lipid binding domain containing protein [Babesia gibsoni]